MVQKKNRKKLDRPAKQKSPFLGREVKRKIWGVILALLALIIVLSFFELAGLGGRGFQTIFNLLFGKTVFAFPLFFLVASLMFFSSRLKSDWLPGLVIFILALAASGMLTLLSKIYSGFSESAGGWLGYLIAFPVQKLFGLWVGLLIFFALLTVGGIIVFYILRPEKKGSSASLEADEEQGEREAVPFAEAKTGASLIKKLFMPKFKVRPIEAAKEKSREETIKKGGIELGEEKAAAEFKYQPPPLDLLERDYGLPTPGDIKANSAIIKKSLQNFDIPVEMSEVNIGPTVTQYTFKPADGIKLAKITGLSNDLALALASHPLRIEAPIPGKSLVGIEVPNKQRVTVRFRNLLEESPIKEKPGFWLALGRDVAGAPFFVDLTKMPHLLIAGATGTGKTICLNSIIISLLYQQSPETMRLVLVDPKRVEFAVYQDLPHLLCPVIFEPQKTVNALKWLIGEMERRFEVLSQVKTKDIMSFNQLALKKHWPPLPYIVLIIDELADLMAARGKDVEAGIVRLAQMARAVGMHLIVATQRPSVEVITGLIKANITSRISFRVASQVDSRTVLDLSGSEKLLGLGDMLFLSPETKKPKRLQGSYVSEKEVKRVVSYLLKKTEEGEFQDTFLAEVEDVSPNDNFQQGRLEIRKGFLTGQGEDFSLKKSLSQALTSGQGVEINTQGTPEDPLYPDAEKIVRQAKKASASLLQRHLRIGYARAARLLDALEAAEVIGPPEGAKPREVYGEGEVHGDGAQEAGPDEKRDESIGNPSRFKFE